MESREFIDDDVVDVAFRSDPLKHVLELRPPCDVSTREARVNVLIDDLEPHLLSLLLAGEALGRERDSFWVVVSVDLLLTTHAEIDDGASPLVVRVAVVGRISSLPTAKHLWRMSELLDIDDCLPVAH
ncbi:hypothetical protein NS183_05790 [Microbacterium testaceum]|nr:hypothetical protein NS183_05790 [Microbacterium testaceum]